MSQLKTIVNLHLVVIGWQRHCTLKAYIVLTFLGRKINLSGISPAKRNRSGPNSVYMDRSRGDNVQRILGAIGPFMAKWGLGRVPRSHSFCVVIQTTFLQLRNGRFSPNLATKRSSVSRQWILKDIFESFHFRGHLFAPKIWNRKSVKQAPHSEQATGHGMHCM